MLGKLIEGTPTPANIERYCRIVREKSGARKALDLAYKLLNRYETGTPEEMSEAARKGAEDTFDSAGYVALLRRLRRQPADEVVYAPEFRREIEEPIANAIPVQPNTPLVITEGNYLLLERGHWAKLRSLLDEVWYVEIDPELRRQRLLRRHEQFGRSPQAARDWVAQTDEPNAALIESTKSRAEVLFRWEEG